MDQDATWYGSRLRPRPHCVTRGPSSRTKGAQQPPPLSTHVYCGHGLPSQLLLSSCCTAHGRVLSGMPVHVLSSKNQSPAGLIVRVPWGWTWIRLIKFFSLQILVAQVVPIENPLDDIASPLGISSNMLIKAAITRNPFLPNIDGSEHARAMKMVSIPRFSRSRNHMRPFLGS